jgi:nitrite reductase/ring-hydroxylating ferredoxin subunit
MNDIVICASNALKEGGKGVRFTLTADAKGNTGHNVGFVVRYDGKVYAYLNRCAHVPIELDWIEGEFFDSSGLYLMCATHGAIYEPETGYCVGGPCRGQRLQAISVIEKDHFVYWQTGNDLNIVSA